MPHGTVNMVGRRVSGTTKIPGFKPPDSGGPDGDDTGTHQIVLPVALNLGTILKLTIPAFVAIVGMISAGVVFYQSSTAHMSNTLIHLGTAERPMLETKPEARAARENMIKVIRVRIDMKHRELKLDQREQIQALGEKISKELKRRR